MVIQTITIECPECGEMVDIDRIDFDLTCGDIGVIVSCSCPECMEDLVGLAE